MHKEIVQRLKENDFEVFFVGGSVRDKLLGIQPKDIDIVTSARAMELYELFRDRDFRTVGMAFGVALIDGIEVATYRTDRYHGFNDKAVTIQLSESIEEDLGRRDLTINAMAEDPFTGEIIDIFNGRQDLERRIIRFVGDPNERIWEDPNRIIRACRFLAKIQGAFDEKTLKAMIHHADSIKKYVTPERIRLEIIKAMEIPQASIFFRALSVIGVLENILPCLENCIEFPGGAFHDEDVGTHCFFTGDNIHPKNKLLKLAGYLHDVGKPISAHIKPGLGDFAFGGHAHDGAKAVCCELRKLKFSNKEISYIKNIVRYHMRIHTIMSPRAIRRLLRDLDKVSLDYIDLVRLQVADRTGNTKKPDPTMKEVRKKVRQFRDELNRKDVKSPLSDLAINGSDVMRIANIGPSPLVGEILNELMDKVIEDPYLNKREILEKLIKDA